MTLVLLGTALYLAATLALLNRISPFRRPHMVVIHEQHASRVLTARHRPAIGRLVWRGWTPRRRFLKHHGLAELRVVRAGETEYRTTWVEALSLS